MKLSDLHILVTKEDGIWYAEGLEIDYCVQGKDPDDVIDRFERGLESSAQEYIDRNGSVEGLFREAPRETWDEAESSQVFAFHSSPDNIKRYYKTLLFCTKELMSEDTASFEVLDFVYTIWYTVDGGMSWKPINSDVVSDSGGQMWLLRAHAERYAEDLRLRGFRCRIASHSFRGWHGSEQAGEVS
jgi:hypothetical protein